MGASTRVSTWMGGNKGSARTCGTTGRCIKGDGKIIGLTGLEYTGGSMEGGIKVSGSRIIWKDMGCMSGVTAGNIRGNTRMIRSMASVYTHGMMGESMRGIGTEESNME